MNVLCIVAHPDDETLGCGGTLARHAAEGDTVYAMRFTDGVGARRSVEDDPNEALADIRLVEWCRALAALGAHQVGGVDYPDQRLDTVSVLELAYPIRRAIDEHQPDIIYTHHPGDLNADHRRVVEAVLVATRPADGSMVKRVLACEIPESTSQAFGAFPPFVPNVYVSLTLDQMKKKQEALACYESETRDPMHLRSMAAVTHQATVRGSERGARRAEAFVLLREVR